MKWEEIFENCSRKCEQFVLGKGISNSEIMKLCDETDFDWPHDFIELYRCHDGVGVLDQLEKRVNWLLRQKLPGVLCIYSMQSLGFQRAESSACHSHLARRPSFQPPFSNPLPQPREAG
jgi:hypothetical protein